MSAAAGNYNNCISSLTRDTVPLKFRQSSLSKKLILGKKTAILRIRNIFTFYETQMICMKMLYKWKQGHENKTIKLSSSNCSSNFELHQRTVRHRVCWFGIGISCFWNCVGIWSRRCRLPKYACRTCSCVFCVCSDSKTLSYNLNNQTMWTNWKLSDWNGRDELENEVNMLVHWLSIS